MTETNYNEHDWTIERPTLTLPRSRDAYPEGEGTIIEMI